MHHHDIKGPDTPRSPHWMGDDLPQLVGDPTLDQLNLPRYGGTGNTKYPEAKLPFSPGIFPLARIDTEHSGLKDDIPFEDRQRL